MIYELMATTAVLRAWRKNPAQTKREIGIWSNWKNGGPEMDVPLTDAEILEMRDRLRTKAPKTFSIEFPDWC